MPNSLAIFLLTFGFLSVTISAIAYRLTPYFMHLNATKDLCKEHNFNYVVGSFREFIKGYDSNSGWDWKYDRDYGFFSGDSSISAFQWFVTRRTITLNGLGFLFKNPIEYYKFLSWKEKKEKFIAESYSKKIENPWAE